MAAWLPFLLQSCDSLFPIGGYAHSFGLEEVVSMGLVSDEKGLLSFIKSHVIPALVHVDLPIVREAHRAAVSQDLAEILELDQMAGALKMARELRESSLHTGQRRLHMMNLLYPTALGQSFYQMIVKDPSKGHHAVVWGVACADLELRPALTAYFYQSISCFCTAAPKLIRLGQEGVQRVLTACLAKTESALEQAERVPRDRIGWFDPVLDIASMRHEIADERLFIS